MQCNKAVDFTSSENSVSNTSKLQSFPISLYNVDNRDKPLPLPLSTTSKAFQCKETGVQESTDNGRKSKSNSSEKRDLLFLPDLHQICLQTFSLNPILNGKTDVSANKKIYFSKYYWCSMYEVIQNDFVPKKSFVFPTTQCLSLHGWFKFLRWLCYSLVEDGAYCLPCLLFAEKINTTAKSFIFKLFKHWPDGMGAFKRHIDPEHGVHNKCMFDFDQLISRLKGKNVSIDVSVNSLSNEKVLNNRKIILDLIDVVKLWGRLGVALRDDSDASKYQPKIGHVPTLAGVGNFVHIIIYALRNGNKDFENHIKTCSRRETYLSATTQIDLPKCCYQVITQVLLKEVNPSKIFALILDEASDISNKEQFSLSSRFADSSNDNSKNHIREEYPLRWGCNL